MTERHCRERGRRGRVVIGCGHSTEQHSGHSTQRYAIALCVLVTLAFAILTFMTVHVRCAFLQLLSWVSSILGAYRSHKRQVSRVDTRQCCAVVDRCPLPNYCPKAQPPSSPPHKQNSSHLALCLTLTSPPRLPNSS
jgi:hypothetical protein